MRNSKLSKITTLAVAIALVTVLTMSITIPTPTTQGYINVGDVMIFIIAAMFGKEYGFIAGGIGSAMADLLGGYFHYIPGTFVIKGIEGLIFGLVVEKLGDRYKNLSLVLAGVLAAAEMVIGYFLYSSIFYGVKGAMTSIPENMVQGYGSLIIALPIIVALKKTVGRFITQN